MHLSLLLSILTVGLSARSEVSCSNRLFPQGLMCDVRVNLFEMQRAFGPTLKQQIGPIGPFLRLICFH